MSLRSPNRARQNPQGQLTLGDYVALTVCTLVTLGVGAAAAMYWFGGSPIRGQRYQHVLLSLVILLALSSELVLLFVTPFCVWRAWRAPTGTAHRRLALWLLVDLALLACVTSYVRYRLGAGVRDLALVHVLEFIFGPIGPFG